MKRRYETADVFTDTLYEGNPVAVVLDAEGLSDAEMQRIAVEFNYSETTFVMPPRDSANSAWVRIFTPSREVPFAGHPNIGTAFVLARLRASRGEGLPDSLTFEEKAGLVRMKLLVEGDLVVGAEFMSPERLSRRGQAAPAAVAAALSLAETDVRVDSHGPEVVSVGLPFLVVELASSEALKRARPERPAFDKVLPRDGATSIYSYVLEGSAGTQGAQAGIRARMFTPRMTEDPATGSATAAVTALLGELVGEDGEFAMRFLQGVEMGRPSLLLARAESEQGRNVRSHVGGHCVCVMDGWLGQGGGP